jgi:hypothetical protein
MNTEITLAFKSPFNLMRPEIHLSINNYKQGCCLTEKRLDFIKKSNMSTLSMEKLSVYSVKHATGTNYLGSMKSS